MPLEEPMAGQPAPDPIIGFAVERVIGRILPAMDANEDVVPLVNSLISLCDIFPEQAQMVQALMKTPPQDVLAFLSQNVPNASRVAAKPHALDWVQRLQETFLADDANQLEEGEEEQEPDGSEAGQDGGQPNG